MICSRRLLSYLDQDLDLRRLCECEECDGGEGEWYHDLREDFSLVFEKRSCSLRSGTCASAVPPPNSVMNSTFPTSGLLERELDSCLLDQNGG